jgi:hypothetical protein
MSKRQTSIVFGSAILLLLFGYGGYVSNNIASDTWNQQAIGNYLNSSLSIKDKLALGKDNCNCQHLTLRTKRKVENRWARIRGQLLSPKLAAQRTLHFLTGSVNPYWLNGKATIVVPEMDYDNAKLYGKDSNPQRVKVKMTGGLKDHFDTERFSIRINSDSSVINSINKVNIYNPKVRLGGLHEWFVHELLLDAGLIPLRTGYVNLTVNEREGVYFYQEQPSIDMLNDLKYQEGLIVRILNTINKGTNENIALIDGVYDKKSLPVDVFEKQIEILNNKLIDYNAGLIGAGDFFSIPKLAKLAAIIDLVAGYHGVEFRNMYFYLNPTTLLLEPIAREFQVIGYSTNGKAGLFHIPTAGRMKEFAMVNKDGRFIGNQLSLQDTNAKVFIDIYTKHLTEISNKSYLDSLFIVLGTELDERQNCLFLANPEFPSFDKQYYYSSQLVVKDYLNNWKKQ